MEPVTIVYPLAAIGPGEPISVANQPFSMIRACVTRVSGNAATAVQATLDNITSPEFQNYVTPANARWFNLANTPTTASGYVDTHGPWRAIRLNFTEADGPIIFQVAQAVTPRA